MKRILYSIILCLIISGCSIQKKERTWCFFVENVENNDIVNISYIFNCPISRQLKLYKDLVVSDCVDGDTIKVRYNDNIKTIRVLGIDTYESKKNKQAYRQAENWNISIDKVIENGKRAKQSCINGWKDKLVNIFCWKKDKYGRDLCFVFSEKDGRYDHYMLSRGDCWYVEPY